MSEIIYKNCTVCGLLLSVTDENFYKSYRTYRKSDKKYLVWRELCKVCHKKKSSESNVSRKCKALGIAVSEWEEWKRLDLERRNLEQMGDVRMVGIPRGTRCSILRKIRLEGYVFISYEQYKLDCISWRSRCKRKYDYGDIDIVSSNVVSESLPDYYIANRMGIGVADIPKDLIELKRLSIKLKREIRCKKV